MAEERVVRVMAEQQVSTDDRKYLEKELVASIGKQDAAKIIELVGLNKAPELVEAIHSCASAETELKSKTREFKKDTEFLNKVVAEKKKYILAIAKDQGVTKIAAGDKTVEIKSRKVSTLHTDKLWGLVCKQKQANLFWKMVKAQLGKAKAIVGEKVLKDAGVLEENIDKYNNVKIV